MDAWKNDRNNFSILALFLSCVWHNNLSIVHKIKGQEFSKSFLLVFNLFLGRHHDVCRPLYPTLDISANFCEVDLPPFFRYLIKKGATFLHFIFFFFILHLPGSLTQFIKLSRCWPLVRMKFRLLSNTHQYTYSW